jgi:hypothetical protein
MVHTLQLLKDYAVVVHGDFDQTIGLQAQNAWLSLSSISYLAIMAPSFDLVAAAEKLLADAKQLTAMGELGSELRAFQLSQRIAHTAHEIIFETAPPMDLVKASWVVVCFIDKCGDRS